MGTYTRVHLENNKTLILQIVEVNHDWKIKLSSQEKGGMCWTTVGFHADSLEKAKKLADDVLAKDHTCVGRCGEWERVPSADRA
jgi:hypothetical protein